MTDDTAPLIVRYDETETPEQRKLRQTQGHPTPQYAFTISGNARGVPARDINGSRERKRDE